jgi:hypothetical protein
MLFRRGAMLLPSTAHLHAGYGQCRRHRWIPPVVLVLLILGTLLFGSVTLVLADTELGHTGLTGRHRLADMYDSPGAVCDIVLPGPDSLGETWLRINPPVMFARDRTAGKDQQEVAWRATVSALDERTGTWRVVRRARVARDLASDDLASYFDGQGWLAEFPLSRATYSATVEMIWYDPLDPARVEGRARHGIEHFMIILRHNGEVSHERTADSCRTPR